jgi:2,4-didehydro-3-deoxy-L-rhamnonate hydrolase
VRLANVKGRAALVLGDEIADVATVSGGRLGPDLAGCYDHWDDLVALAATVDTGSGPLVTADLGCPVPTPRQVFAIGLNYRSHAEESGMAVPDMTATFTTFPASLGGPFDDIEIVGDAVDWEVELVAVIGARADRVDEADSWEHVAGLIGQDISDRTLQFAGGAQFSLGKSRRGYGPMGPGSSRLTRCPTPTTWPCAARSTARPCRPPARMTSCSASPGSSLSCPRWCRSCPAT